MFDIPLHPAVVHIPVGLSVVVPLISAGVAAALIKGWTGKSAWTIVVVLQALLFVGCLVAMETGEDEEETVERIVDERFIEEHEERAEVFVWAAGITLVLAVTGLVGGPQTLRVVSVATTVATVVTFILGFRAGHAGGELVFKHGAASAYADAPSPGIIDEKPHGADDH
jgi:uncharacterized membrane protein